MQQEDPALAHNPLNITARPGVHRAQPGHHPDGVDASEAASELVCAVERLRRDGGADDLHQRRPDGPGLAERQARPVSGGMVVNPAYKGIKLPVDQWPLLSTFEPTKFYKSDTTTASQQPGAVPAARRRPAGQPGGHQRIDAVRVAQLDHGLLADPRASRSNARRSGARPSGPLHDRDHAARRRPALPAASGGAADDERDLRGAERHLAAGGRVLPCAGHSHRHLADPVQLRQARRREPRPIPARWSCTPPCRPPVSRRPTPATTPRCSSSLPPQARSRGRASDSSRPATCR